MADSQLDDLAAVIGQDALDALLAELGGCRIVVPKTAGEHHPIAHAVGLAAAQRLSAAMAGLTFDLPVTPRKRALILDALAHKVPAHKIARTFFCSVRFVYKVQAEHRAAPEPKQMGLF